MILRLTSSSLALALFAAPALALTPEEVWDGWTSEYAAVGYKVTEGSREEADGTLTLNDVVVSMGVEDTKILFTVPQIVMEGAKDGTVRSTFPTDMTGEINAADEDGSVTKVFGTLKMPDAAVVSSGDADNRVDVITAPDVTTTIDRVEPADEDALEDVATIKLSDFNSVIKSTGGGKTLDSSTEIGKADYTISASNADGSFEGSGSFEGIESNGQFTAPAEGVNMQEAMNEALNTGAAINGSFKIGANQHKGDFAGKDDDGKPTSGSYSLGADGAEATVRLAQNGLVYQAAAKGIDTEISGTDIAIPIEYSVANVAFNIETPVSKSDTPKPFKFTYSFDGATLGDDLWASFDPDSKLPRDPAQLDIDISGEAKLTGDLFDPALMASLDEGEDSSGTDDAEDSPDMPFEPTKIDINQILLNAVGAKISAKGSLAPSGEGGINTPVGEINAQIEGANGLMDTLVAMGVLPQDQMQAVRMMMAMFTKPGEEPDSLLSNIEFKDGGQIFANGQQIR